MSPGACGLMKYWFVDSCAEMSEDANTEMVSR